MCAQTRAAPAGGRGRRLAWVWCRGLVPGSGAGAGPLRGRSGKRFPLQPGAHETRRLCPAPRPQGDPREEDAGTAGKAPNERFLLSTFSSERREVSPSLPAPPHGSKHIPNPAASFLGSWQNLTRRCLCKQSPPLRNALQTSFSFLTKCLFIHRETIRVSFYLKGRGSMSLGLRGW